MTNTRRLVSTPLLVDDAAVDVALDDALEAPVDDVDVPEEAAVSLEVEPPVPPFDAEHPATDSEASTVTRARLETIIETS